MAQKSSLTSDEIRKEWIELAKHVSSNAVNYYGSRLLTFAVFGSVARGTARSDSDLDCLLVIDPLPDGRGARLREFDPVDELSLDAVNKAWGSGISADVSPIFKTPAELRIGSPLMLDMTEDILLIFDRDDTTKNLLEDFRLRLKKTGAVKIKQGLQWYWDLKPNFKLGDKIEI